MPRVGSSRSKTSACWCSNRASATFCWLPPESDAAGWPGPVATDAEPRHPGRDLAPPLPELEPTPARMPREGRVREVVFDRPSKSEALALAVFARKADALSDSRPRRCISTHDLPNADLSLDHRPEAEDGAQERGPARADEPGDAQDLATAAAPACAGKAVVLVRKSVELEDRFAG